jgi:hypothetical protein
VTALLLALALAVASPSPTPGPGYDIENFPSYAAATIAVGAYMSGVGTRDGAFAALEAVRLSRQHPCWLERMVATSLLRYVLRAFERDEPVAVQTLASASLAMRRVEWQAPGCAV